MSNGTEHLRPRAASIVKEYLRDYWPTEEAMAGMGSENGHFIAMYAAQSDLLEGGEKRKLKNGVNQEFPSHEKAREYIEAAKTDPAAWSACNAFCASLVSQGEELPPELAEFSAEVMRGNLGKPKGRGLHKRYENLSRNICITNAVQFLLDTIPALPVSQSSATDSEISACAIVARLLRELDRPISDTNKPGFDISTEVDSVYRIYERYKSHHATKTGLHAFKSLY